MDDVVYLVGDQFIQWASCAIPYFNLYKLGINYSLFECSNNMSCDLSQEDAITSLVKSDNVSFCNLDEREINYFK